MRDISTPVHPGKLLVLLLAMVVVWQSVAMWLWLGFPQWDWVMLRISLSFADAISIAALALALYTYREVWLVKREYGTFDVDDAKERRRLEKAGDELDAMESSDEGPETMSAAKRAFRRGSSTAREMKLAANGGKDP